MRKTVTRVTLLALLLAAPAFAQSVDGPTWNRNVERLDFWTVDPAGGDNAFFTYVANATAGANVVLIYPANNSMKEFTQRLYKIRTDLGGGAQTGCNNAYLNGLTYFMPQTVQPPSGLASLQGAYNPARTYPDPGLTYTSSGQRDRLRASITGQPGAYGYGEWPLNVNDTTGGTVAAKCLAIAGAAAAACETCVNSRGYWLNPAAANNDTSINAGVFSTNFLRFHPPKWVMLSLAYKRLVNGPLLSSLREGVVATNGAVGAQLIQKMLPQSCNGTGRPLNQKLAAIDSLSYANTARPLAEMLFNTAWFMGGQDTNPWTWSNNLTYPTTFPNTKSGSCNGCNSDFTILFSDGRGDTANPLCAGSASLFNNPQPAGSTSALCAAPSSGSPSNSCSSVGAATCCRYACTGGYTQWCTRSGGVAGDCNTYLDCGPEAGGSGAAFCTAGAQCTTTGLGTEMDGDNFGLDPAGAYNIWTDVTASTPIGAAVTPAGTCARDYADDVARWMSTANVSSQGTAGSVKVYVVGIGDPANTYGEMSILREVATAGGGNYVAADSFAALEEAIETVFTSIRGQATSFASSAVTTVQTTGTSSAFIPRFTPAIIGAWSGTLSRYVLFNEFASGCDSSDLNAVTTNNPNGNGSCNDFYLKDSVGNFIQEDNTGNFVISNSDAGFDAGWPTVVGTDGGNVLATPYWEAGQKLYQREAAIIAGSPPTEGARAIYTVAPNTTGGYTNTLVPVTVANVTNVAPLLQLGGPTGEMCIAVAAAVGSTGFDGGAECAAEVIRFLHGEDRLRSNPANRTSPPPSPLLPRTNVLGDIFHSSPILVTPPVAKFLCDLGVVNQCVASLYAPTLTNGGNAAYQAYFTSGQSRASNVLVGANDGMLHAFNASNAVMGADGGVASYDTGTGVETWAFIPPDLMPKLVRNMVGERHELMVDGTPMVRDIWVDGSGATGADNAKQDDEFHTVAIINQRQGGRGYTALDVTNPATPRHLWSWPPLGTSEYIQMGQTWGDIGGSPPAIGAVAEYNDPAGPLTCNSSGCSATNIGGVKAREKYVVAFGGGYDPNYIRGRAIYFLDAWTGAQLYRFSDADSTGGSDLRAKLGSIAAPVSMLDVDSDGLFDHAVVGDVEGQVWTVSMANPGRDTTSDGLYDNWFVGRAFEQHIGLDYKLRNPFFQRISTGLLPTGDIRIYLGSGDRARLKDSKGGICGVDNISACLRRDCDVDVTYATYRVGPSPLGAGGHGIAGGITFNGGNNTLTHNATYTANAQASASTWVTNAGLTYAFNCPGGSPDPSSVGVVSCDWGVTVPGQECTTTTVKAPSVSVGQTAAPTIADSRFYSIKLFDVGSRAKFTSSAAAGTYDTARLTDTSLNNVSQCPVAGTSCVLSSVTGDGWFLTHGSQQLPASTHTTDEKTAASALLFGGCSLWSTLDPNGIGGASGSGAGTCDATSPSNIGGECFSNADCGGGTGVCSGGDDNGEDCDNPNDCDGLCNAGRDSGDECRRDSDCRDGAQCVGGGSCSVTNHCVGLGSLSCTPTFPKDTAWSYQADAITGGISCGLAGSQTYAATTRAASRLVSVAPTQPAPVVSVNSATGQISYSAVTLDANTQPTGAVLGTTQISSTVHWLEVPRKVHDCRHSGINCQ